MIWAHKTNTLCITLLTWYLQMPNLHTYLHPGVNRYANSAFTTFAQIYSPVCINLHLICAEQIWSKSIFSSSVGDINLSQTLSIVAPQSLMLTRRFLKYSQILPPYNKIHKVGGKRWNLSVINPLPTQAFSRNSTMIVKHAMLIEIGLRQIWKLVKVSEIARRI